MSQYAQPTLTGVLVQFAGTDAATGADVPLHQAEGAVEYVGLSGLVSKAFLADPAERTLGGFYVWESEQRARDFYASSEWRESVSGLGVEPTFRYFQVGAIATEDGVRTAETQIAAA